MTLAEWGCKVKEYPFFCPSRPTPHLAEHVSCSPQTPVADVGLNMTPQASLHGLDTASIGGPLFLGEADAYSSIHMPGKYFFHHVENAVVLFRPERHTIAENRAHFCDPEAVRRVQEWRREHPGYWRRQARKRSCALQEDCESEAIAEEGVEELGRAERPKGTLQELCQAQTPLLVGLIAHVSGPAASSDPQGLALVCALFLIYFRTRGLVEWAHA